MAAVAVEVHRDAILAAIPLLAPHPVAVAEAGGAVLAQDVHALVPIPAWDNSAMDGYAVRAADTVGAQDGDGAGVLGSEDAGVRLRIVADLPAGSSADPALAPGETARIMTGAVLPSDADAVVQLELTDRTDTLAEVADDVTVLAEVAPGTHVRRAGEDRRVGDLIATAGTLVTPEVISAVVSAGHGQVTVRARPRVVVIATGSELAGPGAALTRGLIPDSNSLLIAGLARRFGAEVVTATRVGDDPAELAAALALHTECDVVVLTGGVSAGAFDPVKRLFTGSEAVRFTKVAMQPGKPQAFGVLEDGRVLFGLPGNPVSAWVSFQVFVRQALLTMQGARDTSAVAIPARTLARWRTPDGRRQYLPAQIASDGEGRLTVTPVAALGSGSHLVGSLAAANGYAVVPASPGVGEVGVGATVDVVLTGPLLGGGS